MMLAWIVILIVVGLVAFRLLTLRLPPASTEGDRRLAEQAERIEQLEDELRRVQEQADFTEKLLSERSGASSEDENEREHPGSGEGSHPRGH